MTSKAARRSVRRVGVVSAVVVFVLALAAVATVWLVDVSRFRGPIERAVESATGWHAEIGEIDLSLMRGLALTVEPASIRAPDRTSSVEIRTIAIHAALLPLLRGRLEVDRVDLIEPKIVLVRDDLERGYVLPGASVAEADEPGAGAPPGSPAEGGGGGAQEVSRVSVSTVGIRDGRLTLEDRTVEPPRIVELSDADLELEPASGALRGTATIGGGSTIEIDGRVGERLGVRFERLPTDWLHRFVGADLVRAGGTLGGRVEIAFPLAIEGELRGESITMLAGTKPFETPVDLRFSISTSGERWQLDRMTLDAGGLVVEGSGPLVPDVDLELTMAETALETVLAASESVLPLPLALEPPGSARATVDVEVPEDGDLVYAARGGLEAARYVVSESLPPVDDVRATFELARDGTLRVDLVDAVVAGGAVDGRATIDSIDPPGTLTLEGDVREAVLGGLIATFVPEAARELRGPTGLDANLGIDLSRATDLTALRGRLEMRSREAAVPGWDLEAAIRREADRRLDALGDTGTLLRAYLEAKADRDDRNVAEAGDALRQVFESLEAMIDFDRYPWSVERLSLAASGIEANGSGTFDPDSGEVDFALTSRLDRARTDALVRDAPGLDALVGDDGRLAVPLTVRGPILRPAIGVDFGAVLENRLGESPREAVESKLEQELEKKAGDWVRGLLGGDEGKDEKKRKEPPPPR